MAILLLALCSLPALAAPRIGVVTMQPGEIFFERFGHNAIVVDDPAGAGPISYNFGYFDMDEPGFFPRFIRGDMRYMLVALPLADDLAYYDEVGRGVAIQWLDLDPGSATALAAALAVNARPENARYRYDYFTDNCSTRVRDAIDRALGGALQRQLRPRSQGNTYRSEAVRLASPAWWMWLGFDLGLGPAADRPNSLWEDAFVPMRLAAALRDARRADGRPLVAEEVEILPHRIAPEPAGSARPWWPWLLAGSAIAVGLAWLGRRRPSTVAGLALPFWGTAGLASILMLFLWIFTEHCFAWANHNLLLLSPLCLGLLPGAWRIARGRDGGRTFRQLLWVVAGSAALAAFLAWLPALPQRNGHWIALLLPLHVAFAWALTPGGPNPADWRRGP
ncbi:DUF4105 domain-containing protein [Luteimonas vadosa]|uniref:lipoprotein N-acyltransferase Lnb domain-containing protein n=1 Tax=Luteimonas vadosa TaxID=1165507 RepID=UPI0031EA8939